jgi:hypothetical protein
MGLLYGADWKRLRKIFDPAFTHAAAVTRIDGVESAARKYVEDLHQLAVDREPNEETFTIPVQKAFTKFPYFLTAKSIYGPMTQEEEDELWRVTEKRVALNQYWVGGGIYRFETTARLCDKPAVQRLEEFNREWYDYNVHMVNVRRRRGEHPPIVTYWEELEAGNISSVEVRLRSIPIHHRGVHLRHHGAYTRYSSCKLSTNCSCSTSMSSHTSRHGSSRSWPATSTSSRNCAKRFQPTKAISTTTSPPQPRTCIAASSSRCVSVLLAVSDPGQCKIVADQLNQSLLLANRQPIPKTSTECWSSRM